MGSILNAPLLISGGYRTFQHPMPDAQRITRWTKKRLGQCVKLELEWKYTTIKEAAAILKAFNPEYINVTYLDAMAGDWKTSEFYVGDRAVPMYNSRMNRWEGISFNIIERAAH